MVQLDYHNQNIYPLGCYTFFVEYTNFMQNLEEYNYIESSTENKVLE